eukprot:TRINITY_DN13665_c0_g1_i1.p1 TRINITY_DN13665_c0_g1~~TRINITY_DN13665_c0_g1_i1.p1  ORF type:complete len:152 (+),score=57.99 TRINITY_DN13665_c0_g1_i1:68-523(+)
MGSSKKKKNKDKDKKKKTRKKKEETKRRGKAKKDKKRKRKRSSSSSSSSSASSTSKSSAATPAAAAPPLDSGIMQELKAALARRAAPTASQATSSADFDDILGKRDGRQAQMARPQEQLTDQQKADIEAHEKQKQDLLKMHRDMRLRGREH